MAGSYKHCVNEELNGRRNLLKGVGMKKKYLCIAGEVISKYDGQKHFISAYRLADLYGVDRRECIYTNENSEKLLGRDVSNFIQLRPRFDGNYTLPISKETK